MKMIVPIISIHIWIIFQLNVSWWRHMNQVMIFYLFAATLLPEISYPLFAYADAGIYPHSASQYQARDKIPRLSKQTRVTN